MCQAFAHESGGPVDSIVSALRAGNIDDAKRQISNALKKSPRDARLWTLNGMTESKSGDARGALSSYKRALELSPGYLPALEAASQIEYERHSQAAVPLLRRAAAIHPGDATVHAMLGDLAARRNDCATAVSEFALSGKQLDGNAFALDQYGACLVKMHQLESAIPVYLQIVGLRPSDNRSRFNLALTQSLARRSSDVLVTLEPLLQSGTSDAEVLDLAAEAYEANGDTPRAVEALRKAILLSPEATGYYVEFANLCLAHASYEVGIEMLNAGLLRLPRAGPLFLARGVLEIQQAEYEKGEEDFATAQRLNPSVDFGAVAAGLAELQRSNFGEAEAKIHRHLEAKPNDAFAWYLLGETVYRGGVTAGTSRFTEALEAARRSVMLQSEFSLGRDLLGRLYLQQGDLEGAIEQSRMAFRADDRDQTALYHLILALRKAGRSDEVSPLVEKLNALKEEARSKDAVTRRYKLFEDKSRGAGLHAEQ